MEQISLISILSCCFLSSKYRSILIWLLKTREDFLSAYAVWLIPPKVGRTTGGPSLPSPWPIILEWLEWSRISELPRFSSFLLLFMLVPSWLPVLLDYALMAPDFDRFMLLWSYWLKRPILSKNFLDLAWYMLLFPLSFLISFLAYIGNALE